MKRGRIYLGIVVSLIVIGYVLLKLDWQQVWITINSLNWDWLIVALLFQIANYYFRSMRFISILDLADFPFLKILGITNLYGMYLYLMPFKVGEASFPLLIKEHLDVPLVKSTAALLVVRFTDFMVIALLIPAMLIFQWTNLSGWLRYGAGLLSMVIFSLWLFFIWLVRNPDKILNSQVMNINLRKAVMKRIRQIILRIFEEILRIDRQKKYWRTLIFTSLIWICIQATLFFIIKSLGFSIVITQVFMITIITLLLSLSPIQGIANLGSHEISWVTAFALFGFTYNDSLNIAVNSHLIYIALSILLGLSGNVLITFWKPKDRPLQ
ncbi:MAG: lysylphosphatidylglycerol synthase transmembrane domain-containing protein [Anaerolineales bacterium]